MYSQDPVMVSARPLSKYQVYGAGQRSSVVRFALLAMVFLSLLFSGAFGAIGILVYIRIQSQMTDFQHISLIFHIFVQGIFSLFCLLGVYACISKHAKATSLFTSMVMGQLLISIASGALCLYLLFNSTSSEPWNVDRCLANAFDSFTRKVCKKTVLIKGLSIGMFVVMWLVEIVTIFLGNTFLMQLHEVEARFDVLNPKYDWESGRDHDF